MDPKGFSTDELREPQKARGPVARVAKNMVLVTTSSSTRHHPCMQARAAKQHWRNTSQSCQRSALSLDCVRA